MSNRWPIHLLTILDFHSQFSYHLLRSHDCSGSKHLQTAESEKKKTKSEQHSDTSYKFWNYATHCSPGSLYQGSQDILGQKHMQTSTS